MADDLPPLGKDDADKRRSEFLLKMYDAYQKQIEQHFGLAWQAVSIFAASIVAIVSSKENVAGIPPYVIISLYLMLVTWALEVIIDAAFWYNRNLVIIANIEKQFLRPDDGRLIHPYFKMHRPFNLPITFLRSLILLLCMLAIATLTIYFFVPQSHGGPNFAHDIVSYVPLVVAVVCVLVLRAFTTEKNRQYAEFKSAAPGISRGPADSTIVEHGLGKRLDLPFPDNAVTFAEDLILRAIGIQTKPL